MTEIGLVADGAQQPPRRWSLNTRDAVLSTDRYGYVPRIWLLWLHGARTDSDNNHIGVRKQTVSDNYGYHSQSGVVMFSVFMYDVCPLR